MKIKEKTPASFHVNFAAVMLFTAFTFVGCGDEGGSEAETHVVITSMMPASPATLNYYQVSASDRIAITFDYFITETAGARIWAEGVAANGSSGGIHEPPPLYKGSGTATIEMSYYSNLPSISIVKMKIWVSDPDKTTKIAETLVDVDYTFTE